jgi:hypothetical protein
MPISAPPSLEGVGGRKNTNEWKQLKYQVQKQLLDAY